MASGSGQPSSSKQWNRYQEFAGPSTPTVWPRSRRSRFSGPASPVSSTSTAADMGAKDSSRRQLSENASKTSKDCSLNRGLESRHKLQNITVDIRRSFPVEGPVIKRNIEPKDLVIARRPGEGATPLSFRREFNASLPVEEHRHVTTTTPPHRDKSSSRDRFSKSRSKSRRDSQSRERSGSRSRRSSTHRKSHSRRSYSADRSRRRKSYSRSRSRGRSSNSRSRRSRSRSLGKHRGRSKSRSRERRRSHSRSRRSRSRSMERRPRRALIEKRYPLRRRSRERTRSPRRLLPFQSFSQPYEMMQLVPVAMVPRAVAPRPILPPGMMMRPPPYMRPRYPPRAMFRPMWAPYHPLRYPSYHPPVRPNDSTQD